MTEEQSHLLDVQNLSVGFRRDGGFTKVVHDVSFQLRPGETVALVGESGSGKSVTSLSLMRLLTGSRAQVSGRAMLRQKNGEIVDLLGIDEPSMRAVRGNEVAMVFQEPMTSLNPVHKVGAQIAEALMTHRCMSRKEANQEALRLLEFVGIPDPGKRLSQFPHNLSGGMRQRIMIAIALACEPSILIADEPTTALDVTVQAQILDLIKEQQERTGMAMIFITHNLGVVAEIADRVIVLYSGRVVEDGGKEAVFDRPLMPYTSALLNSLPRMQAGGSRDIELEAIPGNAPDPAYPPTGCAFHPRCKHRDPSRCDSILPSLDAAVPSHLVRCLRWSELGVQGS